MRNLNEDTITQAVLARHADTPNPRLKEVMTSLVQHLHSFAREVKLTEDEWAQGIEFLTQTGHITNDKRQEFILLSDTLGLSTLVTAMNHRKPPSCTEATVFGPFFVPDSPSYENGADISNGAKGETCFVRGNVKGTDAKAPSGTTMRRLIAESSVGMSRLPKASPNWSSSRSARAMRARRPGKSSLTGCCSRARSALT